MNTYRQYPLNLLFKFILTTESAVSVKENRRVACISARTQIKWLCIFEELEIKGNAAMVTDFNGEIHRGDLEGGVISNTNTQ